MSFVFDKKTRLAIDRERNISISRGAGLWSDSSPPVFKYVYTNPELSFEFGAISHEEKRIFTKNGAEVEWPVTIAMDVLEGSIITGIGCSANKPARPLSTKTFEKLKADIKEGMFTLCMPYRLEDGSPLVPDFKVNFIQRFVSIPRMAATFPTIMALEDNHLTSAWHKHS